MAVSLFKLVMSATTTTIARPTALRYLYKFSTAERSGVRILIPRSKFFDDTGNTVGTAGITTAVASNGYYLLFVNGVVQESGLYTVANSRVTVNSGGDTLPINAPITLIVNNFDPDSTTVVTS